VGNKIIISSADVDGGALRAINIPLMNFSMVFLINLFMPAHHRNQKIFKGFCKVLGAIISEGGNFGQKGLLNGLWNVSNVNNPDLRIRRGKGIFVRFSIFFQVSLRFFKV
jgi:hypothetical protein